MALGSATFKKQWRISHVGSMSGRQTTKLGRSYDALSLGAEKITSRSMFSMVLTPDGTDYGRPI